MTISSPGPSVLSEGRGNKVDRLGCSARKDDFFRRAGAEETCHLAARVFVSVGSACRKLMRRAVNIRVLMLVEIFQSVDNGLRLLRRRGVIEPDERLAVDCLVEDRKIAADGVDIKAFSTGGRCLRALRCSGSRHTDTVRRRRGCVQKIEARACLRDCVVAGIASNAPVTSGDRSNLSSASKGMAMRS